jgi:hypothetical protein
MRQRGLFQMPTVLEQKYVESWWMARGRVGPGLCGNLNFWVFRSSVLEERGFYQAIPRGFTGALRDSQEWLSYITNRPIFRHSCLTSVCRVLG